MTTVFVYGTLRGGQGNHGLLATAVRMQDASIRGRLYLARDGGIPFAVKPDPRGDGSPNRIKGELYSVDDATLARLDQLEGHPHNYRRELVAAETKTATVEAWCYFMAADKAQRYTGPGGLRASGDYIAERAADVRAWELDRETSGSW